MGTCVPTNRRTSTRKTSRIDDISHQEVLDLFEYNARTGELIYKVAPPYKPQFLGRRAGFVDHQGYRMVKIADKRYMAGRLIWFYVKGEWPDEIDHKNLDRADDSWDNLRESTRSQNCANKGGFFKANKFGFRGVKQQSSGKFYATVCANQIEYSSARVGTPELAALAYDMLAKKHHGEFARFNFPETAHRDWLVV